MAGEPAVKGTAVLVGFPSGETMTGIIRDAYDKETTADLEYVRDENNNEATALVSNLGGRIVVDGTASAAVSTAKGDILTIGEGLAAVEYIVEAVTLRHSRTATRVSVTLYRPTQMDPTPEA